MATVQKLLLPTSTALQSIEIEIHDKNCSALQTADFSKQRFEDRCRVKFDEISLVKIQKAMAYAESLPSRDTRHPSMRAYFAHPIRVAEFVLRLSESPAVETVMLALIHNVFEVSEIIETDVINAGFTQRVANSVRLLTIEREQQYDSVYLSEYYRKIEAFGPDLALVKCVDRLDNLLAFDLIKRTSQLGLYMDLTEQFVVPLAARLATDFGDYMLALLNRMRLSECNEVLRLKYEAFMNDAA